MTTDDPRAVCDGYDVATERGVLHFDHEPTDAEVDAVLAALDAPTPVESIEAEDGVVV